MCSSLEDHNLATRIARKVCVYFGLFFPNDNVTIMSIPFCCTHKVMSSCGYIAIASRMNTHVHILITWPLASKWTISYDTTQCVGILLTFLYNPGHVTRWCLEIVLVVYARVHTCTHHILAEVFIGELKGLTLLVISVDLHQGKVQTFLKQKANNDWRHITSWVFL